MDRLLTIIFMFVNVIFVAIYFGVFVDKMLHQFVE